MGVCFSSPAEEQVAVLQAENLALRAQLQSLGHQPTTIPGKAAGDRVVDVLFFPVPAMPCKYGSTCRRGAACTYSHQETSLTRLLGYLGSARQELLVCVFTITCNELAGALLAAHRRGVRVRVITDDEQMRTTGSDVAELMRAGVPVRHDANQYHMHNKVVVIDGRIVATGSLNFTRQAVLNNQENFLVLDSPGAAAAYKRKFEELWTCYKGSGAN